MKKSFLTVIALTSLIIYPSQVFAADTSTLQTKLMSYLPYILIGGAVILLVSIVGILLSKKKEKKEDMVVPSTSPVVEQVTPVETTIVTPEPVQPVNMDDISNNLYTPAVAKPDIQETLESNPALEVQPEFVKPATPTPEPITEPVQSSDLHDILQGEASASPMGPVTNQPMVEEASVISPMGTTALPQTGNQVVEPVNTVTPDLQQFVNNQVTEVPTIMETPAPVATPAPDLSSAPADTSNPTSTGAPFSI